MNKGAMLAVCLTLAVGGCDSGLSRANKKPDIVFRCKTVVQGTTDTVVRYEPIEVIKGHVRGKMLDGDAFLNYTRPIEENESVGEIYLFKLWKVHGETRFMQAPFVNCRMSVELELANGKGITE